MMRFLYNFIRTYTISESLNNISINILRLIIIELNSIDLLILDYNT